MSYARSVSPPPRRSASEVEAATLASAVRLRIIRLTAHAALTNAEIAGRLGRDPATTLYHVRRLVRHGFLVALPARRGKRGAREIPYRGTGLSWALDGVGREVAVAEAMLEAYLAEVSGIGVGELRQTRLVLHLDAEGARALQADLDELLDSYARRHPDPDGGSMAVYLSVYPAEPPQHGGFAPDGWQ